MRGLLIRSLNHLAGALGCVLVPVGDLCVDTVLEDEQLDAVPFFSVWTPRAVERLRIAATGREMEVWVPIGLERRLRAALHRMNADMISAGFDENEQFDTEDDLETAIVSAAGHGVSCFEKQDGVKYDEVTGYPLEDAYLLREESLHGR